MTRKVFSKPEVPAVGVCQCLAKGDGLMCVGVYVLPLQGVLPSVRCAPSRVRQSYYRITHVCTYSSATVRWRGKLRVDAAGKGTSFDDDYRVTIRTCRCAS